MRLHRSSPATRPARFAFSEARASGGARFAIGEAHQQQNSLRLRRSSRERRSSLRLRRSSPGTKLALRLRRSSRERRSSLHAPPSELASNEARFAAFGERRASGGARFAIGEAHQQQLKLASPSAKRLTQRGSLLGLRIRGEARQLIAVLLLRRSSPVVCVGSREASIHHS